MSEIVIVTPGELPVPSEKGGAVETLITHLISENDKSDHHLFHIISPKHSKSNIINKKYNNCSFHYVKTESIIFQVKKIFRFFIKHYLKLNVGNAFVSEVNKILKRIQYEILVIENRPDFILYIKNKENIKNVLHLHNNYLGFNNDNQKSHELLEKYDQVIVVSRYLKEQMAWYENRNKIYILNNAIDIDKYMTSSNHFSNDILNRYSIPINKKIVLFAGRIRESKGVIELAKAFSIINSDIVLVFAGGSSFSSAVDKNIKKKIKKIAGDKISNIFFTGHLNEDELIKLYHVSDVLVIPSIANEAAGLVALEGSATRLNIVSSDSGGLPEYLVGEFCVVKRDDNFVVKLSESIMKMINLQKNDHLKWDSLYKDILMKYGINYFYDRFIEIIHYKGSD